MPPDREHTANLRLMRTYGVSLDAYNRVLWHQFESCGICKRLVSTMKTRLHVDHAHEQPAIIRGLLCSTCNRGLRRLGKWRGNTRCRLAAEQYLASPPWTECFGETLTLPGKITSKRRRKAYRKTRANKLDARQ